MNFITQLFNQYGYIVLYVALTLELIALPTPGESLMTYCGFLAFQGKLNYLISILVASAGVISGITISYLIGSVWGKTFFSKYGRYIHMGPDKLEKTSKWFEKYGNGLLVVAYFIPGVRHITGYFSGITKIPYRKFALNAYIGAMLWTGVFISIGRVLGSGWEQYHAAIKKYLIIGGTIIAVILLCIYLYRSRKQQLMDAVERILLNSLKIFHQLGKLRIAISVTALAFIGLVILVAGLIQDLLANEFGQFDTIAAYLISQTFRSKWVEAFGYMRYFTAYQSLIVVTFLSAVLIMIKGRNRFLEIKMLLFTILGGEALEELLRRLFHRIGPSGTGIAGHSIYTFPSEQALMAIIAYGFAAYLIIRYTHSHLIRTLVITAMLVIGILSGLSPLYFVSQYASDVTAGYVFGGAWLCMNIVLLEILRILPKLRDDINNEREMPRRKHPSR